MKNIHFIAIGGAVMHQLALALQKAGNHISGSDDEIADPAKTNLAAAGILPEPGWHPERIHQGLDAVVLGMHARADNPELQKALSLNIPVYSFPEFVYEAAKDKKRVVIAGSHGKTTITAMVMHVLQQAGLDFDYLVGARLEGFPLSVQLSEAPVMVLEGDEYPASAIEKKPKIFFYHPHITVLNGIAWDHVNVFPTYENYLEQFRQFLNMLAPGSQLFYNATDPEVVRLVKEEGAHLEKTPYGLPAYHYEQGTAVVATGNGPARLSVFGSHNLVNLEAAHAVCLALGVPETAFWESITSFTGAARRLEKITEQPGLIAFRDFAHAPSKLKATLTAVREAFPEHELLAVFELHTFSSLSKNFLEEYTGSMAPADKAVVFYSQHALDLKQLPPLAAQEVAAAFGGQIHVFSRRESLEQWLAEALKKNARPVCLLLMSSGTFEGLDWKDLLSRPAI